MADYTLRFTGAQIDDLLTKAGDAAPKNTVYTKTEVDSKLDGKVDAVSGKGLSTNDFTDNDKTKLDGVESDAQANVQADWNQTDATADDYIKNKPTIPSGVVDQTFDPSSENAQSGTAVSEAIADKVDKVTGKGLSTEDFTTSEKTKLSTIESDAQANVQSDWNQNDSTADDFIKNKPTLSTVATTGSYNDLSNKPTIPTVNNATLEIQKNGVKVGEFSADASSDVTVNIAVPIDANDINALPDTTKYASSIDVSINGLSYVMTTTLKDQDGNTLGTPQTVDLPLETMVVSGSYDDTTHKIILTLNNGTTVDFSVADLVSGLQSEITSVSKLDADLVDDSTSTNKFVTTADKTSWNAKSDFSGSYNDLTDKPTIPAAVTVDQTYDAASTNAQSGTAVAQALAKKPGEIATGKRYVIDGQTVTAGTGAEAFNNLTNNKASGPQSHAEGNYTTASGPQSHAEGSVTTASNIDSHAEGGNTTASGSQSHAEGFATIASGDHSHAEGNSTKASSADQHVQGKFNVEDTNNTYAFIIGNGTANNARHNAFAIDWNGLIYVNGAATGVDVSQLMPVTVDQTYDATSTNAQSGVAIAGVIGNINTVLEEVL